MYGRKPLTKEEKAAQAEEEKKQIPVFLESMDAGNAGIIHWLTAFLDAIFEMNSRYCIA
jgi:hypothetical protein